jgi:hypothetical protein
MDNLSTKASNMTIAFKQLGDDIQKEVLSEFLKNTTDRITALAEAILFFRRSARSETGVALTKDIPIDISNLEAKRDEVERIRRNLIADAKTSIALGATPDSLDPLETYEQSLSRVDNQLKAINNELTIQNAELVKQATNFRLNGKTQADVDKETLMNMNTKNAMGGGGTTIINQSINFATGVVPTVRAEVMKMMPQIAEVTKGAVAEAAMRGGNYRRALARWLN